MNGEQDLEHRVRRVLASDARELHLRSVQLEPVARSVPLGTPHGLVALIALIVVAAVVGGLARAPRAEETGAGGRGAVTASLAASPSAHSVTPRPTAPSASTGAACAAVEVGSISVCPGAGAIGDHIHIEGRSCSSDPRSYVQLVFVGEPEVAGHGTIGGYALPPVWPDAAGRFAVDFVVPASLGDLHGQGGGPTTPGIYRIISKPLYCGAKFIVTP